jgi:hypothetical protein
MGIKLGNFGRILGSAVIILGNCGMSLTFWDNIRCSWDNELG